MKKTNKKVSKKSSFTPKTLRLINHFELEERIEIGRRSAANGEADGFGIGADYHGYGIGGHVGGNSGVDGSSYTVGITIPFYLTTVINKMRLNICSVSFL